MRRLLMGTQNGAPETAISPPAISPTSAHSHDGEHKKGWFGLPVHAVPPIRNNHNLKYKLSNGPPIAGNNTAPLPRTGPATFSAADRHSDEQDSISLPFASDRLVTPHPFSPPRRSTSRNSGQNGANLNHSTSNFGPNSTLTTGFEESDNLMVELLSGQAVVEAKEYGILQWDEMAEIKKEHKILAARIATLSRSVALETRLRDTAAKLIRLADSSSTRSPTTTPSRQQQLSRDKAVAQLTTAESKLATIEIELHRVGWQDSELHRTLLQHTAAVLALALRRREDHERGIVPSPLPASSSDPSRPRDITQIQALSPNSLAIAQFEGHHFFAGNKEAIIPLPRTSPFSSPRLNSSTFAPLAIDPPHPHLDDEIAQLKSTNSALLAQLSQLKSDSISSRHNSDTSQSLIHDLRSEVTSSHQLLLELRKELHTTRDAFSESQEAETIAQKELDELQRQVEEARRDVMMARNGSGDQMRELGEMSSRAALADERVVQLERELEERGSDGEAVTRLRDDLEHVEAERRKLTESIAGVLGRYRSRSTIGPILRDLPPFDEPTDRPDLATYISTTLDSHFDAFSNHLTSPDRTQSDASRSMQAELSTMMTERDNLKKQAQESMAERDRLQSAHEQLGSAHSTLAAEHDQLQSTTASLGNVAEKDLQLTNLDAELSSAREELTHLETELSDLQATNSRLDEELLQTKKQHSKSLGMLKTFETEMGVQKSEAERAKSVLADRNEDLQKYQNTIKELEERAEVAATQEVAMLERLNEFTAILEQTRSEKRKLETQSAASLKSVEADKSSLSQSLSAAQSHLSKTQSDLSAALARPDDSQKLAALEDELQDLRDTISDLEEELSDAKTREAGTRTKLMEELHSVQMEVSGLKTSLRQEQRKRPILPTK